MRQPTISPPHFASQSVRSGNVSLYMIMFMFVAMPALIIALNLWRTVEGKVQQQRFCDACAHAAAIELTSETLTGSGFYSRLLFGVPAEIQSLCQSEVVGESSCIIQAKAYAATNYVDGVLLPLDTTTPQKDVKFGIYNTNDATPTFVEINPTTATTLEKRSINAVRVEGIRSVARLNPIRLFGPFWTGFSHAEMATRTTAILDRRVTGFRIQSNLDANTYQTIPLAPVALISRSVDSPAAVPPVDTLTWERQVEQGANPLDPSQNPIAYGTMIVNIPTTTNGALPTLNSQLLDIGIATVADLNGQLITGITKAQMATHTSLNTELILDAATLLVNVPQLAPPAPDPAPDPMNPTTDFATMLAKFQKLRDDGTERAWPLYKEVNGSTVVVNGFIAARIITVTTPMFAGDYYISLELKPTLLETPTAFTDYSNRFMKTPALGSSVTNSGPPSPYASYSRLVNPYLCRIRMVD